MNSQTRVFVRQTLKATVLLGLCLLPTSLLSVRGECASSESGPKPSSAKPDAATLSQNQVQGMVLSVDDILWKQSDYYWHHGDYPRIIGIDRIITEAEPHFLEPYSGGGWLMESDGDLKSAEAYYKLGADRNPNKSYAWFQLGMFYFNTMHDYPKAAGVFTLSSQLADSDDKDMKMLAHSLEHCNRYSEALGVWKEVKEKYPTSTAVDSNLIRVQRIVDTNTQPSVSEKPIQ